MATRTTGQGAVRGVQPPGPVQIRGFLLGVTRSHADRKRSEDRATGRHSNHPFSSHFWFPLSRIEADAIARAHE
jgi:hypothetical protein